MTDWDRVVTDHGPTVLRLASRILGRGPDAEDAAQEAFLEVYRFAHNEHVENWGGLLRRVVVHRALDRLRYCRRRAAGPLDGSEAARTHDNPPEIAVARELAERLREAIGQLPPQQASVFCLRYFNDLSCTEIAVDLGLEAGTVRTALYKARGKLKAMLALSTQGE